MQQKEILQVPRCVEFVSFKMGVPVKYREEVGRLLDGRVLVLEKDKQGNIVGLEFI